MGWFVDLTGFAEGSYEETKARLSVKGGRLYSRESNKSYGAGTFELASLGQLRGQQAATGRAGRLRLAILQADVRDLHRAPDNAGALFQVASQFNMLEMTGPSVTPEDGVARYAWDNTQGPACAIAAGAGTIYRNYFVPVGDQVGQRADRQLDGLLDIGLALCALTGLPLRDLWRMENGYALATAGGLQAINAALAAETPSGLDALRERLRVGFHREVEVTDNPVLAGQQVSQVFCSAMPIGYSGLAASRWEPLARLVLEASYEAALHCALVNSARSGCSKVFLTLIGAGAFENPRSWVLAALKRALVLFRSVDLDVFLVSHAAPPADLLSLQAEYEAGL